MRGDEQPGISPFRAILIAICAGMLFWLAVALTVLWGLS